MGCTTNSNGGYLKKNRFEWGRGFLSIIFVEAFSNSFDKPKSWPYPHFMPMICSWPIPLAFPMRLSSGGHRGPLSFISWRRASETTNTTAVLRTCGSVVWKMSWQNTNLYNSIFRKKSIIAWIFWFHVATLSTKCDTAGQPHTAVRQVLKVGLRRKNSVQNVCLTRLILFEVMYNTNIAYTYCIMYVYV